MRDRFPSTLSEWPLADVRKPRQGPAQLTAAVAETLAAELVGEMIQRWRQGGRPLPEDFLARHPELWGHPEAAADLIYEELCLRREYGLEISLEQVLHRFPQWRPQLEVMFDCQRLLDPRQPSPRFPSAGETLGDFLLLAELGRGAQGPVFLANQLSLGDRHVVLKLTSRDASEHLSLARLQHTNIVPLYSVQDHPTRGLRAMCMPYFGGATLAQILGRLESIPLARRTARDLFDALHRDDVLTMDTLGVSCSSPRTAVPQPPADTYVHAICRMGACLADAMQYAHDRGLVHLDLKPSNVLLAADGQPMVLDFHLARSPIQAGDDSAWLGGTPGYMSPEQRAALNAVQLGKPAPHTVDERSDIYSLGVTLYDALGGNAPCRASQLALTVLAGDKLGSANALATRTPLHRINSLVTVGLSDIIDRCIADDPNDRYARMSTLACDLRRHVADQPLVGVRNRSVCERWRKWRRRRPHGIAIAGMLAAVVIAAGAVALGVLSHIGERLARADVALQQAQIQMAAGEWDTAVGTLRSGLASVRDLPGQRETVVALQRRLADAQLARTEANRTLLVADLHHLAEDVRILHAAGNLPPNQLREIETSCRRFWENRGRIVERLRSRRSNSLEPAVQSDLIDLAAFWATLQIRLAPPAETDKARAAALAVLDEADSLLGPSPVLEQERQFVAGRQP